MTSIIIAISLMCIQVPYTLYQIYIIFVVLKNEVCKSGVAMNLMDLYTGKCMMHFPYRAFITKFKVLLK